LQKTSSLPDFRASGSGVMDGLRMAARMSERHVRGSCGELAVGTGSRERDLEAARAGQPVL